MLLPKVLIINVLQDSTYASGLEKMKYIFQLKIPPQENNAVMFQAFRNYQGTLRVVKGIFRIQLNIFDETFFAKIEHRNTENYFCEKNSILDVQLGSSGFFAFLLQVRTSIEILLNRIKHEFTCCGADLGINGNFQILNPHTCHL